MPDTTNEDLIASLLDYLDGRLTTDHRWTDAIRGLVAERNALREENNALASRCKVQQDEVLDRVFEMDAMRKRIAELEAHPPADRDRELRERLVCAALGNVNVGGLHRSEVELLGKASVWMVDAAISAMREGDECNR